MIRNISPKSSSKIGRKISTSANNGPLQKMISNLSIPKRTKAQYLRPWNLTSTCLRYSTRLRKWSLQASLKKVVIKMRIWPSFTWWRHASQRAMTVQRRGSWWLLSGKKSTLIARSPRRLRESWPKTSYSTMASSSSSSSLSNSSSSVYFGPGYASK